MINWDLTKITFNLNMNVLDKNTASSCKPKFAKDSFGNELSREGRDFDSLASLRNVTLSDGRARRAARGTDCSRGGGSLGTHPGNETVAMRALLHQVRPRKFNIYLR